MGYYTNYTIEKASQEQICYLQGLSGYIWDGLELRDAKWYDWVKDLKKTSKDYPGAVIILSAVGEESPDYWKAYAKGGEIEVVRGFISYPEPKGFTNG